MTKTKIISRESHMKPSSKFDIVVYGATGFTGQLVAEYLAHHHSGRGDPKWARAAGGTVASTKASFSAGAKDFSLVALLQNPFVLTPGFEGPKQPRGNKPLLDEDMGLWTAPFVMATINTRNVHRSNMLMNFPYGNDFVYDEMGLTGPGEQGEVNAKRLVAAVNAETMGGARQVPHRAGRPAKKSETLFPGGSGHAPARWGELRAGSGGRPQSPPRNGGQPLQP